jgi:hypothetical protein
MAVRGLPELGAKAARALGGVWRLVGAGTALHGASFYGMPHVTNQQASGTRQEGEPI